jgi:hypothetical protein
MTGSSDQGRKLWKCFVVALHKLSLSLIPCREAEVPDAAGRLNRRRRLRRSGFTLSNILLVLIALSCLLSMLWFVLIRTPQPQPQPVATES